MLIVANWKAYIEDIARAKTLLTRVKRVARGSKHTVVLAVPAPYLSLLASGKRSRVAFAAQDVSPSMGGAATGETTSAMLASSGATYVIIGHSERRAAGDTDAVTAEKMSRALAHGLMPILCVGEADRDPEGRYLSRIREEITSALLPLTEKERTQVIIAYEPLWAIGKTAAEAIRSEELAEIALYIRKVLAEHLPGKSSARSLVLYGGSVEPSGVRDLAGATSIDGFLVGHASVDGVLFAAIIKELA